MGAGAIGAVVEAKHVPRPAVLRACHVHPCPIHGSVVSPDMPRAGLAGRMSVLLASTRDDEKSAVSIIIKRDGAPYIRSTLIIPAHVTLCGHAACHLACGWQGERKYLCPFTTPCFGVVYNAIGHNMPVFKADLFALCFFGVACRPCAFPLLKIA